MKKLLYFYFAAVLLFLPTMELVSQPPCNAITFKKDTLPAPCAFVSPCGIRTTFIPRSQGSNMARHIAGWKEYLPGCDGRVWGNLSLALEYNRSFRNERIAQYLFGSTQLKFSGSQVPDRAPDEILADYFGLPTTFQGRIAFKPEIDNIILDVNYELGLDTWCPGLYFKVNAPIVITRWDLGVHCNEVNNLGPQDAPVLPPCYMAGREPDIEENGTQTVGKPIIVPAVTSIRRALSGNVIFGDMDQNLMFGAFPCGRVQRTGVANIDLILGLNFLMNECSHAGIYLLTLIPTGNVPDGKIIFEPMIGNGRLWELGPGISAHVDLLRRGYHSMGIWFEGALTHQFPIFQVRSFDLIDRGPLSRYILLKEFGKGTQARFKDSLINAIDFSTRAVRVGGSVRLDAAVKLAYYYDRWGFDVGYNIYARSKERLRIENSLHPSDLNNREFGIKGTEGVCYQVVNRNTGRLIPPRPGENRDLKSTQYFATIFAGAPVDNPVPVELRNENREAITWNSPLTGDLIQAVQSDPPIKLTAANLDVISGAVPHQLTHKFFVHFDYTAMESCWEPQFGFGAEAEFDGRSEILSGLNQWGVWFKWALSY